MSKWLASIEARKREQWRRGLAGWVRDTLARRLRENLNRRKAAFERELAGVQDVLRRRDKRVSPRRCLMCSSTNVESVDLWRGLRRPKIDGPSKIHFRHPGYGGAMMVHPSEWCITLAFDKCRAYDTERRFLKEIRRQNAA